MASESAPTTRVFEHLSGFHGMSIWLTDANGTLYYVEHAGVWDRPDDDETRSGVYFEDEQIPTGAPSLYRVSIDPNPNSRLHRHIFALHRHDGWHPPRGRWTRGWHAHVWWRHAHG